MLHAAYYNSILVLLLVVQIGPKTYTYRYTKYLTWYIYTWYIRTAVYVVPSGGIIRRKIFITRCLFERSEFLIATCEKKRSRVSNSRTITGLSGGFNPCAIPASTWRHQSRYLSVHHRAPTPLLDAVASGAGKTINARSSSPPTTTWILGAYPPNSKASARRRRCSSRDAARLCALSTLRAGS